MNLPPETLSPKTPRPDRSPNARPRAGPASPSRAVLVSTTDVQEAAAIFGQVYAMTRFDVEVGAPFSCEMSTVRMGPIRRVVGDWNGALKFQSAGLTDRYVLTIAGYGFLQGTQNGEPFEVGPARSGVLFSPGRSITMSIAAAYEGRSLIFEHDALISHFRALTGRDPPKSLLFDGSLRFDSGAGAALYETVALLHRELDRWDASPLWLASLHEAVLTGILVNVQHSASSLLEKPPPRASQACVRRAEEFIAAHATQPITMADIVAAADVPERSLRAAFHAAGRVSPMELLRQHRFEQARLRLEKPTTTTTVAQIVAELGLGNPGRFSSEYKKRFGEAPSETLERGLVRIGLPRRRSR